LKEVALRDQVIDRAELEANAPDLAKLDSVANAFIPPTVPPAAPAKKGKKGKPTAPPAPSRTFAITSGSGIFTFKVRRDPNIVTGSPINALIGQGELKVPSVSTAGLEITELTIPLWMNRGVIRTVYGDKPEGKNTAPPAK